jgi:alginate O-acetyltransferase complex protein AlgI
LLVVLRLGRPWWNELPLFGQRIVTFVLVVIGWVFFRSTDFAMAASLLQKMFSLPGEVSMPGQFVLLGALAVAAALAHLGPNTFELRHSWSRVATVGMAALLVGSLLVIYGARSTPFLYFQF